LCSQFDFTGANAPNAQGFDRGNGTTLISRDPQRARWLRKPHTARRSPFNERSCIALDPG
jgi:hypothetical protein